MKNRYSKLFMFSMLALIQPIAGHAADAAFDEIVVTAQKRAQRLIDVPMGISAISGLELKERGIENIQDLSFAVPGMTLREDGPGSYQIFMRGMANTYGSEALVGVYLDEAPLTMTGYDQLTFVPLDLERVEVLKGPQGTLYGQGSVAGTVRYITKKPVMNEFEGNVEAETYFVNQGESGQKITGVVNVPLVTDKFALRIAGTGEKGGGWIDQPEANITDGNGQNLINFHVKALWNITEDLKADAKVVVYRDKVMLGLGYEEPDRTNEVAIDRSKILIPKNFKYKLYNLDLTYDLGFADLLSATTYIDHDHAYPFSYIGGPETIYGGTLEGYDSRQVSANQFSEEVRMSSKGEGRLHYTIGAFYRDLDRKEYDIYNTLSAGTLYPPGIYIANDTSKSYSFFGDASYQITQRLELGAGLRYFKDDKSTFDGTMTEKDSFDSLDPRAYLSYAVSDNANFYASVSKGFRSGGFNAGVLPNFGPESIISYEVGSKGTLYNGKLSYDIAAYYTDYDDMVRRGLLLVGSQFMSLTSNIGKVEVKGLEGGLTWRPVEALTLNATGAYIHSKVVEVNATDATNIAGDPTDYVPEFSFTLGANYEFNWSSNVPGYVRLDYSYRDKVKYVDRSSFTPQFLPQVSDSLSLLNGRVGAEWNNLSFEIYGTNLTNENKAIDPYTAWSNANRTRPRVIGGKVRVNF